MDPISVLILIFFFIFYFWVSYNTPILATGVIRMLKVSSRKKKTTTEVVSLPSISVIVPTKNEEKVIERLIVSLLNLEYPNDKKEIVLVEDGSTDKTPEICRAYAERYPGIKFVQQEKSTGKPSALNLGFRHAKGEIVAIFDSDNIPESDVLLKAITYFEDPSVGAVQGTTCIVNEDENMLTKFASYEETVWLKNYLQGKDALGLFVPLTGSCQFIRKDVVLEVGPWDEKALAEDLEMSARITEKGYDVRYAPDVISWQEAPSNVTQMVRQRIRWFRGYMEVALKYGRFLRKLRRKTLDAEITLMGPFLLASFILCYLAPFYITFYTVGDTFFSMITQTTMLLTLLTLLIGGIALIYATKPMKIRNVLWLPFIYAYWNLQCILTSYALLQIIFRRPRRWNKTEKTGRYTQSVSYL